MQKLEGTSMNIVQDNIEKLKEIFPEIFTEEKIDFEVLKQLLGEKIETDKERYSFTWKGKTEARQVAQDTSTGTLRPYKKDSKDWDNTENLYIEGDNLEILKLLQKSYHGKIKMIYIDPPYNTGKDFVYKDNFKNNLKNYLEITGQLGEEGQRLSTNSDSSGRYHSDWLNMMYPRLKLARNLLTDDGVIFISIDDNEVENLKKLCDEIFGENNFIANIIRKTGAGSAATNSDSELRKVNDFILLYTKSKDICKLRKKVVGVKEYEYSDENGDYTLGAFQASGSDATREARPNMYYPIYLTSNGELTIYKRDNIIKEFLPNKVKGSDGRWIWKNITFEERKNKFIYFDGEKIYRKIYKNEDEEQLKYQVEKAWLEEYLNSAGTSEVKKLFDGKAVFDHPKSVDLLKFLINLSNNSSEFLVLDFFSGSATTAHAIMQLNAEDGGNRKYIMVQLPEPCDEKSEAYKEGYKNICEIGKERIRRAGEMIKDELQKENAQLKLGEESKKLPDIGFKVFKLDSSNIKEWDSEAEDLKQTLYASIENIKSDRTSLDILYEVLLKYGLDLNVPIVEHDHFYSIGGGTILINLDKEINMDVINSICEEYQNLLEIDEDFKTMVVLRDSAFENDEDKTNMMTRLEQIGIKEVRSI